MTNILSLTELRNSFIGANLLIDPDVTDEELSRQFDSSVLQYVSDLLDYHSQVVEMLADEASDPEIRVAVGAISGFLDGMSVAYSEEAEAGTPITPLPNEGSN